MPLSNDDAAKMLHESIMADLGSKNIQPLDGTQPLECSTCTDGISPIAKQHRNPKGKGIG